MFKVCFKSFNRFSIRSLYKVAPGAAPGAGTAAEWTVGVFLDIR